MKLTSRPRLPLTKSRTDLRDIHLNLGLGNCWCIAIFLNLKTLVGCMGDMAVSVNKIFLLSDY
jgi:hypothetical protein